METQRETIFELIDEVRRFKSTSKIPLNSELSDEKVYTSDEELDKLL